MAPIHGHDIAGCWPMLMRAPTLRLGDLLLEDNGFMDGELIADLKEQWHVDVIVPLRSTLIAFDEALRLAEMAEDWQPHPSRATPQIAFVPGVEHVWGSCRLPSMRVSCDFGTSRNYTPSGQLRGWLSYVHDNRDP